LHSRHWGAGAPPSFAYAATAQTSTILVTVGSSKNRVTTEHQKKDLAAAFGTADKRGRQKAMLKGK